MMRTTFLRQRQQPWLSRILNMPPAKALALILQLYKRTPNFRPQTINLEQRTAKYIQQKFVDTRFKLMGIISRHEKIDAIIRRARKRAAPFEMMLHVNESYESMEELMLEGALNWTQSDREEEMKIQCLEVEGGLQTGYEQLMPPQGRSSDQTLCPNTSDMTLCSYNISPTYAQESALRVNEVLQKIMTDIRKLDLLGEDGFARELNEGPNLLPPIYDSDEEEEEEFGIEGFVKTMPGNYQLMMEQKYAAEHKQSENNDLLYSKPYFKEHQPDFGNNLIGQPDTLSSDYQIAYMDVDESYEWDEQQLNQEESKLDWLAGSTKTVEEELSAAASAAGDAAGIKLCDTILTDHKCAAWSGAGDG